ncbi:MAG: ATP-dependent RecD-like DNA helicase [Candidatus Sericytochromatia bacterium]
MSGAAAEHLEGVVERISFQAENGEYTVLKLQPPGLALTTVVGALPPVYVGEQLSLRGQWQYHAKYGAQFQAQHCEKQLPVSLAGLEKYLSSGLIKGVGAVTAKRLIQAFGTEVVQIIEQTPERLEEIPLIGPRKREQIVASWMAHRAVQGLMVFLQTHGVSATLATRIYRCYGAEAQARLQQNPYQMAEDIWGVGFQTADLLARRLGVAPDHPGRLDAGLLHVLRRSSEAGHVYFPQSAVVQQASELLGLSPERAEAALDMLAERAEVVAEAGQIYLPAFWEAEREVAERLRQRLRPSDAANADSLQVWLDAYALRAQQPLSPEQRDAVVQAASASLLLLTGGPGTGKTTVCRALLDWAEGQGLSLSLASPTGRAARRLSEVTGRPASTLHRLLGFEPHTQRFLRNAQSPLECDLLLVDEVSMIDLLLFQQLLRALPLRTRLVLVGDRDQLPSVGAGAVLQELLKSEVLPAVTLQTIFRQAAASRIVRNAHAVNQGQLPVLLPPVGRYRAEDAFFMAAETPDAAQAAIVELLTQRLPRAGYAPSDIQVLCPMHKGPVGTQQLNLLLQSVLNPPQGQAELQRGQRTLRVGDRVIQLRNNYTHEVFNGDLGQVVALDREAQTLTVHYPEQRVSYDWGELDELGLAYALTVHKSQGSEFPVVVVPVHLQHYMMLQRNLLYTAMTRARRLLVLVGQEKAIALAVENGRQQSRYTRLSERLRAEAEQILPEDTHLADAVLAVRALLETFQQDAVPASDLYCAPD